VIDHVQLLLPVVNKTNFRNNWKLLPMIWS